MSIKSNDELTSYLERQKLNLSLLFDRKSCSLLYNAALHNDLIKLRIYIQHFKAYSELNSPKDNNLYGGDTFRNKLKSWVNAADKEDNLIPIHLAALHGNIEMMEFLE